MCFFESQENIPRDRPLSLGTGIDKERGETGYCNLVGRLGKMSNQTIFITPIVYVSVGPETKSIHKLILIGHHCKTFRENGLVRYLKVTK